MPNFADRIQANKDALAAAKAEVAQAERANAPKVAREQAEAKRRRDERVQKSIDLGQEVVAVLLGSTLERIPLYLSEPLEPIATPDRLRRRKLGQVAHYTQEGYIWPLYEGTRKELTGKHDPYFSDRVIQLSLSNQGNLLIDSGTAPLHQERAITREDGTIHPMTPWTLGAFDLELMSVEGSIDLIESEAFSTEITQLLIDPRTQIDMFTARRNHELAREQKKENVIHQQRQFLRKARDNP